MHYIIYFCTKLNCYNMETKKNIGEAKIVGQPKAPFRFKLKDGCVKSNHLAEESVATGNIQNAAVSTEKIMDEAVTNAKIMNGAITNSKISNGTITNEKIANNSIDNSKIQNLTLTGDKFTDNSIDGSKIKDNSVPGSKLADGAIESIDLQDNTLSGSKLADNSVDGDKLVDGAVTSEKLKDNSIDGSKIADGTIQSLDIKDGSISGSKLVDNSISGIKLSDGIITNNKIADNSITGDKFLDESISGEKIASNTIHGRKLEDNTVDGADIIEGTLNGSKIADMSIDGNKLADDSIETRHIKSNTISGSKIVTDSIDSTKIRNNSLIGENIATGTLTGDKFVDNTITGDKIIDNTIPGSKIKDGTIENVDIKDNTLSGAKLIDNSISGSKIADNAITSAHLLDNSIPASKILDGTIESIDIKDGTLDGSKVKDNTITGAKLADNVITSAKLSDNSVTTDKIVNLAVTEGKIATDAVTSEKISNGSVTETKLGTGAVTTNKIVDNSVTTAKIVDNAVTEDKLADGAITSDKIADDVITELQTIMDEVPTAGSVKPVQSGGVQNELALGAVYDVSAKNPTAGPNNDGKFESLSALLSDASLNTLIPTAYRKGGMSIKFIQGTVQSSDNKYVQYRYVGTSTAVANFSNVANWELDVTSRDLFGLLSEIKGFQIYSYSLQASNKFGTSSSYKHAAIPVNEGEVYYLIGNTDTVKAAYATSNSYSSGGDIPLVSGTGVVSMSAIKQYYKFVIPEGCNFLLFNASGNYGTRCFKYYDSLKDGVYEFVDNEPTAGSDHLVKSEGVFNNLKNMKLVGKGDTLVESPHLTNFKSGNVYRVYIKNPNISLDGVTTSGQKIRFSISAHLLNGNDVDIRKIYTNTYESPLSDFYTFTAPDNFEYVTISMRAANSAEQTFFIEDVSYATVNQNDILHFKENTSTSVVNYSIGNCAILIDGKFGDGESTGSKHGIIKVQEGEDYLVYGSGGYTRYAFATSDEYVPSGDIPLVNGTTVMNVPDNTVKSVVIPDGCEYLLINITITSPFNVKKVLGKIDDIQKEIDEVAAYYMPDILIGNKELYISDQLSSEFTLDTFNKVYNEYDALCTLYPNLIRRKEDIGVDSDGNTIRHYILMNYLPIVGLSSMYTYETVPKENTWDTYFSYKRFLITSGVHGDEKSAVVGLLYFLQDLLASNDDWAVYIKSNVCLDIIPMIDPWGYDNNSRKNKLDIDINRDYFNLTSVEAIAMTNYIQSIKDDIHAVIDNHATSGNLCYLASKTDSERFGVLMKAINQISFSCVTSWDALATQIGLSNIYRNYAYGCISVNVGTLPDYIIRENITPLACTVETIKRTNFMNPVAKFTKDIIGNLIQMLITVN